jgi:hypothetical protein
MHIMLTPRHHARTPRHYDDSKTTGGITKIAPRVFGPFTKTTNPMFNIMTLFDDVPIGSSITVSVHELVSYFLHIGSQGVKESVHFCHGKAILTPWCSQIAGPSCTFGVWVDLMPPTPIANDHGPLVKVTLVIMPSTPDPQTEVEEVPTPDEEVPTPDQGQGVLVSEGVKESWCTQELGSACLFYIDPIMQKPAANLWVDQVVGGSPVGIPVSGCRNYNCLAMGYDWASKDYHASSVAPGMPTENIPKELKGMLEGLDLYVEQNASRAVLVSEGVDVVKRWCNHLEPMP